ncbi:hypothetical protein ACHAWF_016120, partial [Thalassiosira exigua]
SWDRFPARGGAVDDRRREVGTTSSSSLRVAPSRRGAATSAAAEVDALDSPHDDDASSSDPRSFRSHPPPLSSGHIAFRLARRTDVPRIQKCNLATLPENYNSNFYVNHMRTWPELTLVAEHVPEGLDEEEDEGDGWGSSGDGRITPLGEFWGRQRRERAEGRPQREIVGYILGKVEERPIEPRRQIFPPSRVVPLYDPGYYGDEPTTLSSYLEGSRGGPRFPSRRRDLPVEVERLGHVTSLAVRSHARRLGVASSLLRQLHHHLRECHGATSVGLHVRISNEAAVRLYCEDGYDVADIMPRYYGDGEDAYFMRKELGSEVEEKRGEEERESRRRRRRSEQRWQQHPQQRQRIRPRRGEAEREAFLHRDATSGSFFDDRPSLRESLSAEERAWVDRSPAVDGAASAPAANGGGAPSLSGSVFARGVRTLFQASDPQNFGRARRRPMSEGRLGSPPWETGPEGLRLPRYRRVAPRVDAVVGAGSVNDDGADSLAARRGGGENAEDHGAGYCQKEGGSALALEAEVASGSV